MATKINGTELNVPVWGGHRKGLLSTWSEIKKLGFKKRDRLFGTLDDGRQALYFQAIKLGSSLTDEQIKNCQYEWYVTTETLEEITD